MKTNKTDTESYLPDSPDGLTLEGKHSVLEALRADQPIERLFVLKESKDSQLQSILREAKKKHTMVDFVTAERLDQLAETDHHQGVIARLSAFRYADLSDMFDISEKAGEPLFLFLLDGIEDPHNLGAIIRTAHQAGAHGVIIPKRRAVGLTATAVAASAGAIHHIPVARVTNLSDTIKQLKEKGVWFVCADMDGDVMYNLNLTGPIGIVVGSEGAGVSRLVKENCDMVAQIPMKGKINSLNASVAAGVLGYEIVRQRIMKQ
ncbi:MAG: 23S rRNA (guanosine(2251)-2'-O)-methyltransferase RlmB [Eubacterium sp.]|nr:23S rRNA (guanosine(2251)-2'-O)-methyltransferase RlmB [Eubacterium sp.]